MICYLFFFWNKSLPNTAGQGKKLANRICERAVDNRLTHFPDTEAERTRVVAIFEYLPPLRQEQILILPPTKAE